MLTWLLPFSNAYPPNLEHLCIFGLSVIKNIRCQVTLIFQIPAKPWSQADDSVVQAIANILTKEEQAVGLTNPATKDIEKRLSFERRNDRNDRNERHDRYQRKAFLV